MSRRPLPYSAGTWFAVPLDGGHWAAGLAAHIDPAGRAIIGYFFGPFDTIPSMSQLARFRPNEAVLVGKFGDLHIIRGTWPIIGNQEPWEVGEWPLPVFANRDPITNRLRRVVYAPDDLLRPVVFEEVADRELHGAPEDGAMGARYVELRLARLLGVG